jgi:MFS superfamily sulfate permease-like transporter
VLGGFMCGVAILIALSQVPHVLGLAPGDAEAGTRMARGGPAADLWVGLATAAIIFAVARYWKSALAALVGSRERR